MFSFYMPVKVHFGKKVVQKNVEDIIKWGSHAFIVTGKHSAVASGALKDIANVLSEHHIDYTVFNEITENPELTTVQFGAKRMLEEHCDFIIGIGGGSPLDAAKAISVIAANELCDHELFNIELHKKAYPIVAVPTTSGTGSEVTQYSVITDTERKIKAGFGHAFLFPKVAYIDPRYTISLSESSTRDTAIDALSHLLEGLYSNQRNIMLYPIIHQGIYLIFHNLLRCLNFPNDYESRENLMLGSVYGGITIAHTGTTMQHSLGYPLTTEYGYTHGYTNGLVLKQVMEYYYPHIQKEIDDLFDSLGVTKEVFFEWIDALDFSLQEKLSNDFINSKIHEVLKSRNMVNNPVNVNADDIRRIYLTLK